jgi:uncharacterized protein (TIGR02147 family)
MPNPPGKPGKPNILEYFDYRQYLSDLFAFRKSQSPVFSHRAIIHKAGYKSPTVLKNVMDGKRHLSQESAERFAKAFGLDDLEQKYFLALVRFQVSSSMKEKEKLLLEITELKRSESPFKLEERHLQVLERWWHLPIRELTALPDFRNSSKWISRILRPGIKLEEAAESLSLLKELGLIQKKGDSWKPAQKTVKTDPQVSSVLAAHFHREMIRLGGEAITRFPPEQREITGAVLRLSLEDMEKVKGLVRKFQETLLNLAANSRNADQVFALNLQLFPLALVNRPKRINEDGAGTDDDA